MKFDTPEQPNGAIPAQARSGGSPSRLSRRRSQVVQSNLPVWLQESFSLLTMAVGLVLLFLLWRAAAFVIKAAGGSPQ